MKKRILDPETEKMIEEIEAQPKHGEDFCDDCGECLHCYGGELCECGGAHVWVEYKEKET